MNSLARALLDRMPELSVERSAAPALANATQNLPYLQHTIAELRDDRHRVESAVVVSAGPSLHRRDSVAQLLEHGYDGAVVATDGALSHCLHCGLVPDYVVTLDPHSVRVCRWFGDVKLASRTEHSYFRRQELDPRLGVNERARNQELIELVNRHGPRINAVIGTSVFPEVAQRCAQAGLPLYWWNPILDDPDDPAGLTQQLYRLNRAPCMVSGGNVGSAARVFAHSVLGASDVAVVGMDLGYAPDIPVEKTQYYPELHALFGERAKDALVSIYNPHLKETWYADPAYYWYRQGFLEMAAQADCATYNCTEGGTVFGKGLKWMTLKAFLQRRRPRREAR